MSNAIETTITPEMDRHNGRIFFFSYLMIFLSAPAVYVGVVQATLCDHLGASKTVANLPAATYLLGQLGPLICSWLVPHRLEKSALIWASRIWATLVVLVLLTLVSPQPAWVRITAVTAQGLLQGIAASVAQVFAFQCLGRGTTAAGRTRTFKWTYTLGPIGAVLGSLAAQYIMKPGFSWAPFPYNFALIYAIAAPCIGIMALLNTRWRLVPLADEPRPPFFNFISTSFRHYFAVSALLLVFGAYVLWNCAQAITPSLALHARTAMNQDPQNVSGMAFVMRFACKAVGGYFLGSLALRFGLRASAIACLAFTAAATIWSGTVSGYGYLFAFGLMGIGELGGAYFPAFALAISPTNLGPRNLSILNLAVPAASFAPVLMGGLTDKWGFIASVACALSLAALGLFLLAAIKKTTKPHVL